MGITDEQYRWIIDKSYWVDKNKTDCEYHIEENKTYNFTDNDTRLGEFRVLSAKDNTSNGMQAMEVVPINKVTGQVDHRHKYDVIGNVVGNEKKKLFMLYYKAIIG